MKQQFIQFINNPLVEKLAIIAVGVVITWLIIKTIQRRLLFNIKDNDNRYRAKKFSNFTGYIIVAILIMVVFSNRLGGLTMALGVAGAGIAFALQEVIVSFAGWLTIMVGGFYKSGDRVQLGGIKGDVMDIGVLRTTIMETGQWVDGDLYNGRIVLIANSFVFKEPVFNYSGEFPFLWDEIKIPIQYGSDYDKVKEILLRAGKEVAGDLTTQSREQWHALQIKYRLEEAQTEPMVSLIANDNWVEFTLRFVVSYKKRRATKTELFTRILKEVDATNGAVKFASATFHLVDAPEIKVKIS
jgi:small-conductance mechanosensitive channel